MIKYLKKLFKKDDVAFIKKDLHHLEHDFKAKNSDFLFFQIGHLKNDDKLVYLNLVFKSFKINVVFSSQEYKQQTSKITARLLSSFKQAQTFKESALYKDIIAYNCLYAVSSNWLHSSKGVYFNDENNTLTIQFNYSKRSKKAEILSKEYNEFNLGFINMPSYWIYNDSNESYFWFGELTSLIALNEEELTNFFKQNATLLPRKAEININKEELEYFALDLLKQTNNTSAMSLLSLFRFFFNKNLNYDLKKQELVFSTRTFNFFYQPDDKNSQIVAGWTVFKEALNKLGAFNKEYDYISKTANAFNKQPAKLPTHLPKLVFPADYTIDLTNHYADLKKHSLSALYSYYISGIYLFWKDEAKKELAKKGQLEEYNVEFLRNQLDKCLKTMKFYKTIKEVEDVEKEEQIEQIEEKPARIKF